MAAPVPLEFRDLSPKVQKWLVDNIIDPTTGSVTQAEFDTLEGRVTTAENDIGALEDINTAEESGQVTLSSGTASVSFAANKSAATYEISLSGDAAEIFSWASKAVGGFTINSNNGSSTANVDWAIHL